MIVLGIDPGTATTGFGLLLEHEDGSLSVIDYGVILTPANDPMPERLMALHRKLQEIILLHHPNSGAVEKLFFQRNVKTALSVGQARGVVLLSMAEAGMEIAEYTPMEVKQAVAGYGGADKNQVQQMVRALLDLNEIPHPDDAADALAIAICHIHSSRMKTMIEGAA
jgi:crossover junction endodeoxyribonuclease RuvC